MLENKQEMIELLTGVKSSKKNYYTELKQTVEELRRKNIQLEIINDIMKSIKVDMSLSEILRNISLKLQSLISCDRLSLYLKRNNQLILTNLYPTDNPDLAVGFTIPNENSLYWQALQNKQIIKQDIVQTTEVFFERDYLLSLRVHSVIILPIYMKNKEIGVLSIGRKSNSEWIKDDLVFLEQLTNHLAIHIENSQLYEEVVRAKQQWEDTFTAVADMIVVFDEHLNVLKYNRAFQQFFEIDVALSIFTTLGSELKRFVEETFQTKTPGYRDYFYQSSICEAYTYPVHNERAEVYGVILYLKDVTKKRQTDSQLLHAGKLAAIGEMAAGIAHELNSPLTAILGNSQLLLRNTSPNEKHYLLLNDIKNCGNRCKKIIKSLLTFSRQDEYDFDYFSLNDAVNEVLHLVKHQFHHHDIDIILKLEEHLPFIQGSQQQIEQIIVNLLLNAKDALEESGKAKKEITIKTSFSKKEVVLCVQDNGIGIEREKLNEIFHPFYTTKIAEKGSGLGLSVSLGIAKDHGGTIDVTSSLHKGSQFLLRLPLRPSVKTEV